MSRFHDTASLAPVLTDGTWLFCTLPPAAVDASLLAAAAATVQETEGLTMVLPAAAVAGHASLAGSFPCRRISLGAATELAATGIMAAVADRLADVAVPCNPMAGYHHDHLYVPEAKADLAMAVLAAPGDAWQLIRCWFGPLDSDGLVSASQRQRWFKVDPDFDAALRDRFGALHNAALAGDDLGWPATAIGRLALVLLLDQLSRNLHRGSGNAFAGDTRALACARAALAAGDSTLLPPEYAAFLLLPHEHAEDLAAQAEGLQWQQQVLEQAPAAFRPVASAYLEHAREHAALVQRFDRFPHRNNALGRTNSADEAAWLAGNHKRFGQ